MNVLHIKQGSLEWLAVRARHDTASEAPAAIGVSKYTSRDELLRQKATGLAPDVDDFKQALFDRGHEAETSARTMAEEIIGDDLYAITVSREVDELRLLASLDGSTMDGKIIWEHKLYSETLAASVAAGTLAPHYTVQMDQELFVSGAERCLFMTSDGTPERMAWCWYESTPEKFAALISGWRQFRADLAAYVPQAVVEPTVAATIGALPALTVTVEGRVTGSNLDVFRVAAFEFLSKIKTDLKTDQDFADAASTVKFCEEGEKRLELVKAQALAQTASIDDLFRTIDEISGQMRGKRLALDKLVKARKEEIRTEIVMAGQKALEAHCQALNTRLGQNWMPRIDAGFALAIKGLKTVDSIRNAVDTALAHTKIEANAIADRIETNRKATVIDGKDWMFLFGDFGPLATTLEPASFAAVLAQRVSQHEARVAEALRVADEARAAAAAALPAPAPSPAVVPVRPGPLAAAAAKTDERPTLNAGTLCKRLGFIVTVDFLTDELRVPPAHTERRSSLWTESQFLTICERLQKHIATVAQRVQHDEAVAA